MKNIDILAIGDIATDVFIKIKEAEAKCDLNGEHCKLCLNYGGKIPYESAEISSAVGNSPNVSICTSRLGLNTSIMTNIGGDQNGIDCLKILENEKINTNLIKKEDNLPTNYHYVLWYAKEHTILTKHEKYNYSWPKIEANNSPSWIYLSSLGENSLPFYNVIIEYLKANSNVKLAFSPGTYQIKFGAEALKDIYQNTKVFICNHEESQEILKTEEKDITKLVKMIRNLGPKIVVITDGIKGAYSYDGNEILFMKALLGPDVESTGAGDSFSGAFLSALFWNKGIGDALIWGMVNSMSVVSYVGPHKGLLTKDQMEEHLKNLPEDFKPTKLN